MTGRAAAKSLGGQLDGSQGMVRIESCDDVVVSDGFGGDFRQTRFAGPDFQIHVPSDEIGVVAGGLGK